MSLSIVIAFSKKFDLGNDILARLEKTINNVFENTNKNKIETEVILVNWNSDKNDNINSLVKVEESEYMKLKLINVSSEIHSTYRESDKIPFYISYAKNVGIRRASFENIMILNPGVLILEESWKELSNVLKNKIEKLYFVKRREEVSLLDNDEVLREYSLTELKCFDLDRIYRYDNFKDSNCLLISKKFIDEVRGFPELSTYINSKLDSIFVENLLKVINFEYLLEIKTIMTKKIKSPGYEDTELLDYLMKSRIACEGEFDFMINRIKSSNNYIIFNDENWGLTDIELEEISL